MAVMMKAPAAVQVASSLGDINRAAQTAVTERGRFGMAQQIFQRRSMLGLLPVQGGLQTQSGIGTVRRPAAGVGQAEPGQTDHVEDGRPYLGSPRFWQLNRQPGSAGRHEELSEEDATDVPSTVA
jgi:hypothetical protein